MAKAPSKSALRSRRWRKRHPHAAYKSTMKWRKRHLKKWRKDEATWRLNNKRPLREQRLMKQYGLTLADFDILIRKQKNLCAICRRPFLRITSSHAHMSPVVDHCHKTGKVRSLLCRGCNIMIGIADDSTLRLNRAIKYLKTHRS